MRILELQGSEWKERIQVPCDVKRILLTELPEAMHVCEIVTDIMDTEGRIGREERRMSESRNSGNTDKGLRS
jgi:hypothetical protein